MTKKELLKTMEGHEILSTKFEKCVGIIDGQIWAEGKIIDPKPTKKTLNALWGELFYQEFGTFSVANLI